MAEDSYIEKHTREVNSGFESSERRSRFERKLFREGVLSFDFDGYVKKANERLERSRDWYQKANWDTRRSAENLTMEFEDAQHELVWRQRFSGQVPKKWNIWYGARKDFEEAKDVGAQLSSTLIDAGISHPHHLVAYAAGRSQKLNSRQLTWVFVRSDLPSWNRKEIIEAQIDMGVSEKEIQNAREIADKIREEVRKRRSGGSSLQEPPFFKKLPE